MYASINESTSNTYRGGLDVGHDSPQTRILVVVRFHEGNILLVSRGCDVSSPWSTPPHCKSRQCYVHLSQTIASRPPRSRLIVCPNMDNVYTINSSMPFERNSNDRIRMIFYVYLVIFTSVLWETREKTTWKRKERKELRQGMCSIWLQP